MIPFTWRCTGHSWSDRDNGEIFGHSEWDRQWNPLAGKGTDLREEKSWEWSARPIDRTDGTIDKDAHCWLDKGLLGRIISSRHRNGHKANGGQLTQWIVIEKHSEREKDWHTLLLHCSYRFDYTSPVLSIRRGTMASGTNGTITRTLLFLLPNGFVFWRHSGKCQLDCHCGLQLEVPSSCRLYHWRPITATRASAQATASSLKLPSCRQDGQKFTIALVIVFPLRKSTFWQTLGTI